MIVVVTGTGTGVGKTIVSAALCSVAQGSVAAGRVAYFKVAQTGVPGDRPDVEVVSELAPGTIVVEGARYPDPMSPEAAARLRGLPEASLTAAVATALGLAARHDVVIVEGAGGLLVRYASDGWGIAALATALGAPLVVVAGTALGTLNALALTLEAISARGLTLAGVVIGSWPAEPTTLDLSNLLDMTALAGGALAGRVPADAIAAGFAELADSAIGPELRTLLG